MLILSLGRRRRTLHLYPIPRRKRDLLKIMSCSTSIRRGAQDFQSPSRSHISLLFTGASCVSVLCIIMSGLSYSRSATIQDYRDLPKHITIAGASLPSFHMMGALSQLFYPIASLQSIAVFPPMAYCDPIKAPVIPNSDNTIKVVQATKSSSMLVVPAFLEEWVNSRQALDALRSLENVVRTVISPFIN